MSDDLIARARLHSQRLTVPAPSPLEAVRHVCALQAQDSAWGLWSVGLRVASPTGGATQVAVEDALATGAIVRTWPMRRTLHLVAGADARWMLGLLAPRAVDQAAGRRAELGIDDADVSRSRDLWQAALHGRRRLTRSAMLTLLDEAGLSTAGQRGYHLLVHHAMCGLLCLGPNQGKEQTYLLLEEWTPPAPDWSRGEALAHLARRYFTGHGPATPQDLARWAYLTLDDVRTGLAAAGPELEQVVLDGRTYWMAPGALDLPPAAANPTVILGAGFDEIVIGYADRSATLAREHEALVVPGGNGVFKPVVLLEGRAVGTWSRTLRRKQVEVRVEPFAGAPFADDDSRAALERAARGYGDFVGLPAQVSVAAP